MITVTGWTKQPGDGNRDYQIEAFADTKEEVVPGATFVGMPSGEMQHGSSVLTAAGDVGFLKSDGTWAWL